MYLERTHSTAYREHILATAHSHLSVLSKNQYRYPCTPHARSAVYDKDKAIPLTRLPVQAGSARHTDTTPTHPPMTATNSTSTLKHLRAPPPPAPFGYQEHSRDPQTRNQTRLCGPQTRRWRHTVSPWKNGAKGTGTAMSGCHEDVREARKARGRRRTGT